MRSGRISTRWRARRVVAAAVLASLVGLAACSSDDDGGAGGADTSPTDPATEVTDVTDVTDDTGPASVPAATTTAETAAPPTVSSSPAMEPPTTEPPTTGPPGTAGQPAFDGPVAVPTGERGFYEPPDPVPAAPHGALLRYQQVMPSVHADSRTWRMMYVSESVAGDPIVVTGLAVVPTAAAPRNGRNVVTLVHGTTGSADRCAPSKQPSAAGELSLLGPTVAAGTLVAATDYEGMGTPGVHPYLVGESEGRAGLDAALAAGQLPGADAGVQLGVMGYSQGGHSAMWTAELAAEWTPELDLVGTFAGAPPTEIGLIVGARVTGAAASFVFLLVAGYEQAYGDRVDPAEYLSERGLAGLDDADRLCVGDLAGAVSGSTADIYVPDAGSEGAWAEVASENDAGTEAVDAPLLIVHSSTDDVVPAVLSATAFERLCGLGQVVDRRDPDLGGHGEAAVPAYEQAQEWMQRRFADGGDGARSTCPR